jgi:uncharacterized integral membrane protein
MSDQEKTKPSTPADGTDPLRGSRTSATWVALAGLVVLLVLLLIFIVQNTQEVSVSFLGWSGRGPLSVALLVATTSGMVVAVIAGALRILQLRRRIRRER